MQSSEVRLKQAQRTLEQVEKRIEEQLSLIEELAARGKEAAAAERRLADLVDRPGKLTLHRDSLERAGSNAPVA